MRKVEILKSENVALLEENVNSFISSLDGAIVDIMFSSAGMGSGEYGEVIFSVCIVYTPSRYL